MIEIISGCTRIGNRIVSAADGPFITEPEIEKRLVNLGVAQYLDAAASPAPAVPDEDAETSASTGQPENAAEGKKTVSARLDPEQLKTMKNLQLKKLAKDMGIDVTDLRTNAELIEAITSVDVEIDAEEDNDGADEDAPDLTPEDIVV